MILHMYINYAKIIAEKSKHTYSFSNESSVGSFTENLTRLMSEPDNVINKHLPDICTNKLGLPFIKYYSVTEGLDVDDIKPLIENFDEIDDVTQSRFNAVIEYKSSMAYLRDSTNYKLASDRFISACEASSVYLDELDMIGYNINTSPETISRYAALMTNIDTLPYNEIAPIIPQLLKRNTEMIVGLRVVLSGQVANLIVSMPNALCTRVIEDGTLKQQREFVKLIDGNVNIVKAYIKSADPRHYNLYTSYLDMLYYTKKRILNKVQKAVTEATCLEHIATMQPDVVMYEEGVIDDPVAELEELLTNICFDETPELSEESVNELTRIGNQINNMYIVDEAGKLTRKAAYKVEDKSRKVASKAASANAENKRTGHALKKATHPVVNAVNQWINKVKEMDKKERRERIITREFRLKLFKYIRKLILIVATWKVGMAVATHYGILATFVSPLLILIGIAASLAIDQALDAKVRRQIMRELEEELAVVNEKLEDARGDANKQNKYQLIRIKKKLEGDLERVRFNLKSS